MFLRRIFLPFLASFLVFIGCDMENHRGGAISSDKNEPLDGEEDVSAFVSKWRIDLDGGKVVLPLPDGYNYDFTVDWGDGEVTSHNNAKASHAYKNSGVYTVTITGLVEAWDFSRVPHSKDMLVSIDDLGSVGWRNLHGAFWHCKNLTSVSGGDTSSVYTMRAAFNGALAATMDIGSWDTSAVEDMSGMFMQASVANPDVSGWDTGSVVNMDSTFRDAVAANPDVSAWNTSEVVDMGHLFAGAISADPDVSGWDTSKVVNMSNMFREATSANPDVSEWDVSNVISMSFMFAEAISADPQVSKWNTENVTTMRGMFSRATSANPAVNNWNTASVTNMAGMFMDAISANPKLNCWDVSRVTDMRYMFSGAVSIDADFSKWNFASVAFMQNIFNEVTLTTRAYSNLLIRVAGTSPRSNLILDAGSSMYDSSAIEARQALIDRGWRVIDAGRDPAADESNSTAETSSSSAEVEG